MFLDFNFTSKRYISEMFSWIPMIKDDKRLYWFTAGLCGRKYITYIHLYLHMYNESLTRACMLHINCNYCSHMSVSYTYAGSI